MNVNAGLYPSVGPSLSICMPHACPQLQHVSIFIQKAAELLSQNHDSIYFLLHLYYMKLYLFIPLTVFCFFCCLCGENVKVTLQDALQFT